MTDYSLQITPISASGGKTKAQPIVLPLCPSDQELPISTAAVRNYDKYQIEILCSKQLAVGCDARWKVLLNGEEINSIPHWLSSTGTVVLPRKFDELYFNDLLGYALFQLRITQSDGTTETFKCSPIRILFKRDKQAKHTETIARYVIEQGCEYLVKHYEPVYDPSGKASETALGGSDIISFVERIIQVYEFDLEYFRSNSRAKIKIEGRVDALEKLRSFTSETLRFIATHPEELVPSNQSTGIKSGALSFIPRRSWIQGDRMDRNVYENQIVLGFLRTVINHLSGLTKGIEIVNVRDEEEEKRLEKEGLFDSSILIKRGLSFEEEKIFGLISKLRGLFLLYQEFLQADPLIINRAPEPTAVFMSIPAYSRVYKLLYDWFNVRKVKLIKSSFFLEPTRTSRIYEYYCLIKLIKEVLHKDFYIVKQEEIKWPAETDLNEENINNIYQFKSNTEEQVTLYYQPVIRANLNNAAELLLYRNSTGHISENGYLAYGNTGECYTPDYVLKYEKKGNGGPAKYIIADAKFSQSKEIINKELLKLIFKYQTSISVIHDKDSMSGLSVFCGKGKSERKPPLFNIKNPVTGEIPDSGIYICDVQPEVDDHMIPTGFLANEDAL